MLAAKPTFKAEENLAPHIWLVAYDVPEDQVLTIAKSDAGIFNGLTNSDALSEFHTQAKDRYAYIGYLEEELKKYCRSDNKVGCVEQVEKDQAKLRPLLQDNQKMIERAEKITKFRVHYSLMELHIQSPLPKFNAGRELLLVHYADLFLSGAQESALEKVCSDITFWRSVG